jgi:hypothetical protein
MCVSLKEQSTPIKDTTPGGLASMRVHLLTLAIVLAGLAAPFVLLSMQVDSAPLVLSEPAALDPLDLR